MAAKGTESKKIITEKILETFDNSFLYNNGKEIRIPIMEDGAEVQIKVTLTAAKVNVVRGEDNLMPGSQPVSTGAVQTVVKQAAPENKNITITDEEKKNVSELLKSLGLN